MKFRRRRGSAVIEFSLVGIPMIFLIISIFSMGLGMWNYHTMANAVSMTTRALAVRGAESVNKGRAAMTVDQVARLLARNGIGLAPSLMNVTLVANATGAAVSRSCNPLTSCFGNSSVWPPAGSNGQGTAIRIVARYPIGLPGMFWAGEGGTEANTHTVGAAAQEEIQF